MIPVLTIARNLFALAQITKDTIELIYQAQVWIAMYEPIIQGLQDELNQALAENKDPFAIQNIKRDLKLCEALGNAVIMRILLPYLSSNIVNADQTISAMNTLFNMCGLEKNAYSAALGIGLPDMNETTFNNKANALKADFDALKYKLECKRFKANNLLLNSKNIGDLESYHYRMLLPKEVKEYQGDITLYKELKENFPLIEVYETKAWDESKSSAVIKKATIENQYKSANDFKSIVGAMAMMRNNIMAFMEEDRVLDCNFLEVRLGEDRIVVTPAIVVSRMLHSNEMNIGLPILFRKVATISTFENVDKILELDSRVQLKQAVLFLENVNGAFLRNEALKAEIIETIEADKNLNFQGRFHKDVLHRREVILMLAVSACLQKKKDSILSDDMNLYRMASLVDLKNMPKISIEDLQKLKDLGILNQEDFELLTNTDGKPAVFESFNSMIKHNGADILEKIAADTEDIATKIEYSNELEKNLNSPAMVNYLINEQGFMLGLIGAAALKLNDYNNGKKGDGKNALEKEALARGRTFFDTMSQDISSIENRIVDLMNQIKMLRKHVGYEDVELTELMQALFTKEQMKIITPIIQEVEHKTKQHHANKNQTHDSKHHRPPHAHITKRNELEGRLSGLKPVFLKKPSDKDSIVGKYHNLYQELYNRAAHKIHEVSKTEYTSDEREQFKGSKKTDDEKNQLRINIAVHILDALDGLKKIQELLDNIVALDIQLGTIDQSDIENSIQNFRSEHEKVVVKIETLVLNLEEMKKNNNNASPNNGLAVKISKIENDISLLRSKQMNLNNQISLLENKQRYLHDLSLVILQVGQYINLQDIATKDKHHRFLDHYFAYLEELHAKHNISELQPKLLKAHLNPHKTDNKNMEYFKNFMTDKREKEAPPQDNSKAGRRTV